jgi:hypothetical protein
MHEWMEGIKHLLMRNGMGNAWENPNNLHEQSFPKLFKQRLDDQYVQKWFSTMTKSNRFDVLANIKTTYEMSNHLKNIKNPDIRNTISRLRVDLKKLEICQGTKKGIPKDQRFCPKCSPQVETVQHFLLHCRAYDEKRAQLYCKLKQCGLTNIETMPDGQKIRLLLDTKTTVPDNAQMAIHKYIADIYSCRLQKESANQ